MTRLQYILGLLTIVVVVGIVGAKYVQDRRDDTNVRQRVTIDYWEKWTGIEADAMRAVVDDFNRSQDRITVRMLSVSQIDQKLMLAISADRPPDVAGLWSHSVNVYAERNALTPLDAMLKSAGVCGEDYIPVFWSLCQHKGFSWALPSTPAVVALHWNRRLFREAGLDPDQPPRSIAELDAMAERLTIVRIDRNGVKQDVHFSDLTPAERETKAFDIVQLGYSPGIPGWWNPMWGAWFGGALVEGDRTVTCDSASNRDAFEWVRDYSTRNGLDNLRALGSSFGNFASPNDPFLSGRVAMVLQGVWLQNFIEKYSPDLEWGVAAFPTHDPAALKDVSLVETDVLVIPRGAPHPQEAFEFIRFVNTRPQLEKVAIGQRKISPLKNVSSDFYERHPNPMARRYAELAQSPNATAVPRVAVWMEYSDEMAAAVDRISSLIQEPVDALADVKSRIQRRLDRSNRRWDIVGEVRQQEWRDRMLVPATSDREGLE